MLKNLSLRYKISLIAVIGCLAIVIYQAANYRLSLQVSEKLQALVTDQLQLLQFANRAQLNFSELNKLYQASLAGADPETLDEANHRALLLRLEFEKLQKRYNITDALFIQTYKSYVAYIDETSSHTRAVLDNNPSYDEILKGYSLVNRLREKYLGNQKALIQRHYQDFENRLYEIDQDERVLVQTGLYIGLTFTFILVVVSIVIIGRILNAFNNAVNVAEQIASGNFNERIKIFSHDETGKLMQSLQKMRDVLKIESESSIQREQAQTFLSSLNEAMRGDKSMFELAEAIGNYMASSLTVQTMAFYRIEDNRLVRLFDINYPKTTYDYPLDGENIYSQAAKQSQIQSFDKLPEFYSDHLGPQGFPNSLVLFPVLHDGRFQCLIELAAFHSFTKNDLQLLRRSSSSIAVSVASAMSRFELANMLEQTQIQAVELNRQREKLAQINTQLEEKTHVLDVQKTQIMSKNSELEGSRKALLEKTSALELSGKYKSQFLSTMSHELRTPLNSILILSQTLQDNRLNNLSDKEVEHSKIIHTAGSDLLALINDILDLSKVEEGKMDVVVDEIHIENLSTQLKTQFELMAKEHDLNYQVTIDEGLPKYFFCDKQRLNQIVRNFISNSLKFTDDGGVFVDIGYPSEDFLTAATKDHPEDYLLFKVTDTGVGIAKEKQDLVFEAFKQADGTTSRKFGGTGLGLTISKELAHLLGGDIILKSDGLGSGSCFALLVPFGSREDITMQATVSQRPQLLSDFSDGLTEYPVFEKVSPPKQVLVDDIVVFDQSKIIHHALQSLSDTAKSFLVKLNHIGQLKQYLEIKKPQALLISYACYKQLLDLDNVIDEHLAVYLLPPHDDELEQFSGNVSIVNDYDESAINALFESIIYGRIPGQEKVLFVEDNPVFYQVISSLFQKSDLDVAIADDGESAMRMLTQQLFDYLVIDLNLPDYNGFDLIKAIRSLSSYQDKKILLFTAEDIMQKEKLEIMRYADEVIFKSPTSIAEIRDDALQFVQAKKKVKQLAIPNDDVLVEEFRYKRGMLNGRKLLLVDDDERNLYSMSSVLEAEGVVVELAESGKKALECLKNNKDIELVLLDIMMPEMDGFEVLAIIRGDQALAHLPVFALTAKAMLGDKQICLDAGASDYYSKPVDVDDLLAGIARHLGVVDSASS